MNTPEDTSLQSEDWRDHPAAKSPSTLAPEAWDRRERDPHAIPAFFVLGRAARYLIADQMRADRTFLPGAWDAVELLWAAMDRVEQTRITRQRVERLTSVWLPQQMLASFKGSEPGH